MEFSERFSCKLYNYESHHEYYHKASCCNFVKEGRVGWRVEKKNLAYVSYTLSLDKIGIPLLCLSALDDPLVPESSIPYTGLQCNKNVILITTQQGGHLAWTTAKGTSWMDAVISDYIQCSLSTRNEF
jgi:predicted alpha/beta-fold hydrolase